MTDLKVDNKYAWLEPYCALYRCEPKMLEAKKDREPFNSFRLGGEVTRVFSREGEVEGRGGKRSGCRWDRASLSPPSDHAALEAERTPRHHPDPCATDAGGRNTRQHHGEENGGSSRLSSSAQGAERQGRPGWLTL